MEHRPLQRDNRIQPSRGTQLGCRGGCWSTLLQHFHRRGCRTSTGQTTRCILVPFGMTDFPTFHYFSCFSPILQSGSVLTTPYVVLGPLARMRAACLGNSGGANPCVKHPAPCTVSTRSWDLCCGYEPRYWRLV